MKLQIKTAKFKEMLSKAIKGASNNKLIPLTSLIAIKLKDGEMTLTTTDATNYLCVKEQVDGGDFYAVVQCDTLAKLIARMTCDNITLEVTDSSLTVSGNGTYKIDVPLDEDGEQIKYPNPAELFSRVNKIGTITAVTIKKILTSVKPALLTTMDFPWYASYYIGDTVIATDTFKISSLDEKLFDEPKLISADVMNLLDVVSDDSVDVYADGNKLLFDATHCTIYGVEPAGIEEFSVDAINGLIGQKFSSKCVLSRSKMLQLLDRISLFVGVYDNGEISLTFTPNGVNVISKLATGTEQLSYVEVSNFKDFVCSVDITMLTSQIKAQSGDTFELWYGEDNAIKIVDNDITSVVALLTE